MKNQKISKIKIQTLIYTVITIIAVSLIMIPSAFSHGGKKHGENNFTSFMALKEATKLYGQLIEKGKLPESWEMELKSISISTRQKQDDTEFVVSFEKSSGDPNIVFIFLDATGKYSGSNFTGE
jgi:hypothetical protein